MQFAGVGELILQFLDAIAGKGDEKLDAIRRRIRNRESCPLRCRSGSPSFAGRRESRPRRSPRRTETMQAQRQRANGKPHRKSPFFERLSPTVGKKRFDERILHSCQVRAHGLEPGPLIERHEKDQFIGVAKRLAQADLQLLESGGMLLGVHVRWPRARQRCFPLDRGSARDRRAPARPYPPSNRCAPDRFRRWPSLAEDFGLGHRIALQLKLVLIFRAGILRGKSGREDGAKRHAHQQGQKRIGQFESHKWDAGPRYFPAAPAQLAEQKLQPRPRLKFLIGTLAAIQFQKLLISGGCFGFPS